MKKVLAVLLLMAVALSVSCQTVEYLSPQTVEWDEPEGVTTGYYILVSYTVEVIHSFSDKADEGAYLPIDSGLTIEEVIVNLETSGYQGVFAVAISAALVKTSDNSVVDPARAYSDNIDDVAATQEPFYIILEPGRKARVLRIR